MSSAARRGRVPRRLPPGAGLASACARLWLPPQPPARPCSGSGADGSSGPQRTAQPQPPQHTVVTRSARGRNGAGRTQNARPRQLWGPRAVIASYSPSQVSKYLYLRICISICRKLRVASHMQPCCQEDVAPCPQSFGEEGARLGRGRERTHDRAMPVQKPATPEELQALFDQGGKLVVYLSATW